MKLRDYDVIDARTAQTFARRNSEQGMTSMRRQIFSQIRAAIESGDSNTMIWDYYNFTDADKEYFQSLGYRIEETRLQDPEMTEGTAQMIRSPMASSGTNFTIYWS